MYGILLTVRGWAIPSVGERQVAHPSVLPTGYVNGDLQIWIPCIGRVPTAARPERAEFICTFARRANN